MTADHRTCTGTLGPWRKIIKTRGSFPTDEAALKLLFSGARAPGTESMPLSALFTQTSGRTRETYTEPRFHRFMAKQTARHFPAAVRPLCMS